MLKRIFDFIYNSIQAVVLALSIFVLIYFLVAQPNQVHGRSMMPNFHDGEFILTEKITYRMREPVRGEVVVFKAPPSEPCAEDQCEYIKRIIALPGDRVRLRTGRIWINDRLLEEGYLPREMKTQPGSFLREGREVVIPAGHYLVLGDNRPHSRDGREFGPIPRQNIIGRAILRYWPLSRFGIIKTSKALLFQWRVTTRTSFLCLITTLST